jgi:hypothetical protein
MHRLFRSTLFALIGLLLTASVYAQGTYDASSDFSSTSNPNGTWQYGYTNTLGSSFILDTIHVTGTDPSGTGYQGWDGNVSGVNGIHFPYIWKYNNYTPLGLQPGPNGQYADLRWTAPSSGAWMVDAVIQAADPAATSDFHLLKNGVALLSGNINGQSGSQSYMNPLSFSPGDVLDVVVGFGSNGNYYDDTTGVSLTLSSVPEMDTAVIAVLGLAGTCVLSLKTRTRK